MLITYQTRVNIMNPDTWEESVNEIGERIRRLYLSESAAHIVEEDETYSAAGSGAIRETWRVCLAELAAERLRQKFLASLVTLWYDTSFGRKKDRVQKQLQENNGYVPCILSVVFLASSENNKIMIVEPEPLVDVEIEYND